MIFQTFIQQHSKKYFLDRSIYTFPREYGRKQVKAMIVPHAGSSYVYDILQNAFTDCPNYQHIVVFTTNHSDRQNYVFPHPFFLREHSFLSIIPFLEFYGQRITLFAIGDSTDETLLSELKSAQYEDVDLWIANTDLIHCYEDVPCKQSMDVWNRETIRALQTLRMPENVQSRQQRMCGTSAISFFCTLLSTHIPTLKWTQMYYSRSDWIQGTSAVGYCALLYNKSLTLSNEDYRPLAAHARKILYPSLSLSSSPSPPPYICQLRNITGIFVTLYHQNRLYGCLGTFTLRERNTWKDLIETIRYQAEQSAYADPRFPSNRALPNSADIRMDVNFLHERVPVSYSELCSGSVFQLGKHGIYVHFQDGSTATYLASVIPSLITPSTQWTEGSCQTILSSLAQKAGTSTPFHKIEIYECYECPI